MRGALLLLCGLAGGVIGALLVRHLGDEPEPRTVREARRGVTDAPTRKEFDELRQRLRRLEQRAPGEAAPGDGRNAEAAGTPTARPDEAEDAPAGREDGGDAADAEKKRTPSEVVQALVGKPFGYNESNRLVWWLSRNKDQISKVIEGIEAEIEKNPNDPNLQVALAAAWTAELINQPQGPQQGILWGKVGAAYDAAIALDPNHWQARFGKAFGTSMAPEWLGLRPEAIRQFEELKVIQGRRAPEPQHAMVYFRLGTLYKDAGNAEKARAIWAEGLKLFPDSQELKDTLEASTKK